MDRTLLATVGLLNHAGLTAIVTCVSREGREAPPTCVRARWHAL